MGKTMERQYGREDARTIMERVKVGSIVRIVGRQQAHPRQRDPSLQAQALAATSVILKAASEMSGAAATFCVDAVESDPEAIAVEAVQESTCGEDAEDRLASEAARQGRLAAEAAVAAAEILDAKAILARYGRQQRILDVVVEHVEVLHKNRCVVLRLSGSNLVRVVAAATTAAPAEYSPQQLLLSCRAYSFPCNTMLR